ncbi:hypothetical protein PVL29_006927 [Vitis rotundifolia]|uniref:Uncharacterized protein n=1 Tax=Vitis rotundifolia TaxID=103349 RepID=A0AA39A6Q7_VITRO|nr:hypothetical protein PVL29_006927 [Vitis rotundifolia]
MLHMCVHISTGPCEAFEKGSFTKLGGAHQDGHFAKILVYDSFMPWVQDVATRLGLDGAAFFTQSCAVFAIYYLVNHGALNLPLEGEVASMAWMPLLCINDLPLIIDGKSSDTAVLSFLLNQFSNFQKVKWILFNTFDKLEDEVLSVTPTNRTTYHYMLSNWFMLLNSLPEFH